MNGKRYLLDTNYELLEDLTVFDLTASDDALLQEAVAVRIDGGFKLPDAVIAATALVNGCEVITNDARSPSARSTHAGNCRVSKV